MLRPSFLFFLFILLFSNVTLRAQIVNIESLRMEQDSAGFTGAETFSFSLVQNTQRLLQFSNNLAMQYRRISNVFLLVNNLQYAKSANNDFERNGYLHLRHNYLLSQKWSTELFAQYQINLPLRIEGRTLLGAGLRYILIKKESSGLAAGAAAMYENDVELDNSITNETVRGSFYISAVFSKKKRFSFSTILYYQPNFYAFNDYRLSGQTRFTFDLWKGLQFVATGTVNYDAFPVVDAAIPKLTYKVTNGLGYTF